MSKGSSELFRFYEYSQERQEWYISKMVSPRRIIFGLGFLACILLCIFPPYDIGGELISTVGYAFIGHLPVVDPTEGGGVDLLVLSTQLLFIVQGAMTGLIALKNPMRFISVLGLILGLGIMMLMIAASLSGRGGLPFPIFVFFGTAAANVFLGTPLAVRATRYWNHGD